VAIQPFAVGNLDTAENKPPSLDQLMDVVTNANMIHSAEYGVRCYGDQDFLLWYLSLSTALFGTLKVKRIIAHPPSGLLERE
jgi:hypothetical protein